MWYNPTPSHKFMNCKRCNGTGEEPNQKDIGRHYKSLRVLRGIGLREMAACMGISHGFLSQLESGQRTWSRSLIASFDKQMNKHTK